MKKIRLLIAKWLLKPTTITKEELLETTGIDIVALVKDAAKKNAEVINETMPQMLAQLPNETLEKAIVANTKLSNWQKFVIVDALNAKKISDLYK